MVPTLMAVCAKGLRRSGISVHGISMRFDAALFAAEPLPERHSQVDLEFL